MSETRRPPAQEDIIREVSRDVLERAKTVTDKRSAQYRLGRKYKKEKGVEIKSLMKEKPIFYEQQEGAEKMVDIDPALKEFLPPEFFDSPSAWIEKQDNQLKRPSAESDMPSGGSIRELWRAPYDITKVKELLLRKVGPNGAEERMSIISKRLKKDGLAEADLAKKAYHAGIPTPRVLGEIADKGNNYVWFEKIDGMDLHEALVALDRGFRFLGDILFNCLYEDEALKELNEPRQGDSRQAFDSLLPEQKTRILGLWREARKWLIAREVFVAHNAVRKTRADYFENLRFLKNMVKKEDIEYVFKSIGYESYQSFLDGLHSGIAEFGGQKFLEFPDQSQLQSIEALAGRASNKAAGFREKACDYFEQCLFGFGVEEEKERIKMLCDKNGLTHKDFANRNFMVEWDWARNLPQVTDDHVPQLFVIDWDPNPDLPKKPSKKITADKSA